MYFCFESVPFKVLLKADRIGEKGQVNKLSFADCFVLNVWLLCSGIIRFFYFHNLNPYVLHLIKILALSNCQLKKNGTFWASFDYTNTWVIENKLHPLLHLGKIKCLCMYHSKQKKSFFLHEDTTHFFLKIVCLSNIAKYPRSVLVLLRVLFGAFEP